MKKFALIAISLFVSIICVSQLDYSGWQEIESEKYQIKCPPNWKVDIMGDMGITMMAASPLKGDGDRFKENFGVLVKDHSKGPINLQEFATEQVSEIKNGMDNTTFLGSQHLSKNDKDMYRITYVRNQNGMELLYDSRIMIVDDFSYMLIFTMERSKFSEYKNVVNQIVESLEVN